MKRILLSVCIVWGFLEGYSQSHIRINDYWDNLYYINPASVSDQYSYTISSVGRLQWVGLNGAPKTLFLSGTKFFERFHVQLGAKAYMDEIGLTKSSSISLSYAYNLSLNEIWKLNMGLSPSFMSLHYDMNKATLDNMFDPAFQSQMLSENKFNTDLGFELTNRNFKLGVSSQNLLSLFTTKTKYQRNTNIMYATYRTHDGYFMDYGLGISGFQYANIFQPEMKASVFLKGERASELFQVGLFYRYSNELGAILGLNLFPGLQTIYSYDFNIGSISRSSIGTHELMVIYKVNLCPTCY